MKASQLMHVWLNPPADRLAMKSLRNYEKNVIPLKGSWTKTVIPKKFSRDLESDWTAMKDDPLFGLKEHTSVDMNNGFILATTITPASVNDTNYLPYCMVYSRHTKKPIEKVYPDKGYLPS